MVFPVSGIEVSPMVPILVAFVISFFTSMAGISGAFLLLPFQVSVLGFVSPSVTPTNLVFNIVAIPAGVYRYFRERRMAWPLAWIIIVGTLPGLFIGAVFRVKYLPDPKNFKFFIGCVLLYIGARLLYDLTVTGSRSKERTRSLEKRFKQRFVNSSRAKSLESTESVTIGTVKFSLTNCTYEFYGELFSFNTVALFSLALVVGIIGGAYGIGGGAIIAPFLITVLGLPVYTIAGAALLGTFLTSVAGVVFYIIIAPHYEHIGFVIAPDWILGGLFGFGGLIGMYCGARMQKFIPAKVIELILGITILLLAVGYIGIHIG